MRQVHLCDPQLHSAGGHYLNHDTQLVRELQRRGIPVSLYGRSGCSVTCAGLTPEPVFTHDIFQEAATDSQVWAIENFQALNQAFSTDLSRLTTDRFTADDLVYFPNLLQNQLYGVALWLARFPADRRPVVAVMLRYLNHAMDYVQARANKELIVHFYRYAARTLFRVQPRSLICADTRELAIAYQRILGLPVHELPNPMDVSGLLASTPPRDAARPPTIVYQGHTSPLRGLHFLPEIVERCAGLSPRPRFIIQIQSREAATAQLGPTLSRLEQLAAARQDVTLVNGALSPEDYFRLLQDADLVLLPYSPTFYGHGSSGVFTEAASLGKVVVVSPGTVPARQGSEYALGVVTAASWTAPAMADAVALALRDFPALQQRALAGAPRFRAEQSARALWDKLLAAVPAPQSPGR